MATSTNVGISDNLTLFLLQNNAEFAIRAAEYEQLTAPGCQFLALA